MSSIKITDWSIPGSGGQPIYGNTHWPEQSMLLEQGQPRGVLICAHGFKGYKDYGFFPGLCSAAAQAGLLAHRFNFSHSGMTNQINTFKHPELFEKDTWGKQVFDLVQMRSIAWHTRRFPGQSSLDYTLETPVVVFGHSRGGVTSLLEASRSYASDFYHRHWPSLEYCGYLLAGLITAAAPDYACNLDDLVKDQLRAEGRLLSPSGRTGQDLYVGLGWLEEIEHDPELYDPVLAAAHVKCPMLIIHGDDDSTVPVDSAQSLHKAATPNSRLEIIAGANHVFNCPNPPPGGPYSDLPEQTRKMIELSVDFAVACCEKARSAG